MHKLKSHLRALTATVERFQHGIELGGDDVRAGALSLACVVGIVALWRVEEAVHMVGGLVMSFGGFGKTDVSKSDGTLSEEIEELTRSTVMTFDGVGTASSGVVGG